MSRKKIVFIIDIKPAVSESSEFNHEDNWRQIRFSVLRLLTYFGGKHKSSGGKVGTGPLWGFKFYKSSGGHLEYGNHHFFDLKLKDFESFEEEFKERVDQTSYEQSLTSSDISSQLSCALAEVVAGFQWERPDFYSPIKAKRKDPNRKQEDIRNNTMNNFVFLFTPCPGCCGDVGYFSQKKNATSSSCLKSLLMKEELYRKIVFESKVSLHWIDTGQNQRQAQEHFHKTLSETMKFFSGSLVHLNNLSYWWVQNENESTAITKSCQPAPFTTFIDSILSNSSNNNRRDKDTKLSIDVYKLTLSLKGSFQTSESNSSSLSIPIILRNATIRDVSRRKVPQNHVTAANRVPQTARAEEVQATESDQQEKELQCDNEQGNITIIKSVFKSSAALYLLQDIQESFYCSCDQMNSDPKSIRLLAYQQLLKILKAKKLILVLQLNHPEDGHQVNACLQPWTNMSAIITIISDIAPLTSFGKEGSADFSAKQQTALIEKLVDNIHKKLGLTKLAKKDSNRDSVEEINKVGEGLSTSSFMQSLDYWFYDLPSHSVNPSIHENIQRIKGTEAETAQRANQRSSALFGKLKKHYEQQRNADKAEKTETEENKAIKPKRPVIASPKIKSLAATRSEQLLVKSKAFKKKRKSEEELKEKEKQKLIEEADRKWKESNGVNIEEEGSVVDDFDISKECQDLPSMKSEDFAEYIKTELTDVLHKDLDSCAPVARRLSKDLVIYLHKMNQGKEVEEIVSPDGFLEEIFEEITSQCNNEQKSSKVSRHLLHVLMELEIAALLAVKDSKKSDKPENSDQGGHQNIKKLEDAEKPPQLENAINSAKSDQETDPGKSDQDEDKSGSDSEKSGSESEKSNPELEKLKAIAEKIVRQLRPVMFLENPVFLAKYLNTTILPRFKTRIPKILREVYDGLGQETPNDIVTPSKRKSNGDESFETIIDHVETDSVVFSDYGSNNPSNQSGVSLRRFSSISDNMGSKRQIVVPLKKAKKSSKKKLQKGFKAEIDIENSNELSDLSDNKGGWCRNLFETGLDNNVLPVKGSKKRKLQRRYSEMAPAVKDTPARKQKRHFFWKRQHKERRKTDGITDVTVIEESPLKDCHIAESPVKNSGASRFLSRSQSFNCKTSPRRFYAFQRSSSILQASPRKPFGRSFSCLTESDRVIKTPEKNHTTERSLNQLMKISRDTSLDKTITNDNNESLNGESPTLFATPRKGGGVSPSRTPLKREPTFLAGDTPKKKEARSLLTPRKRNSSLDSNSSKDEFTSIMDRTPQKRRRFSETRSTGYSFYDDSSETARPKPVLDLLDIASQSSSGGFDVRLSSKPVFYSEDSMDWVAMFGNDKSNQVSHNEIDESPLPTMDSVPSLKGSESGSLVGSSPNIFTPIREGMQPFSSPFLSASSLETLENAPILSPRLRGSKSKRESTCRKRIEITNDD